MFQALYDAGVVPLTGTATLNVTSFTTVSGQVDVLFPHGTLTATCPMGGNGGTGSPVSISISF